MHGILTILKPTTLHTHSLRITIKRLLAKGGRYVGKDEALENKSGNSSGLEYAQCQFKKLKIDNYIFV